MRRARSSGSCARCARTRCRSTIWGSTRRWIPPSRRRCSSTARPSSRWSTPRATGRRRTRDCCERPVAKGGLPMKRGARIFGIAVASAGVVACLLSLALAQPAANEVLQWNETTIKAIEANGQSNVVATRTLAMVQGAVHDALNAINRRYDAYYFEGPADPAASPDAAVAAAAHTVLVGVVSSFGTPAQKGAALALVEQAYSASLARVTDGPARNKGVAVGRAAGAAMLALRKDDGATRDAPYTPGMGPGKWRPHPNPVPPNPPIGNPELAPGSSP